MGFSFDRVWAVNVLICSMTGLLCDVGISGISSGFVLSFISSTLSSGHSIPIFYQSLFTQFLMLEYIVRYFSRFIFHCNISECLLRIDSTDFHTGLFLQSISASGRHHQQKKLDVHSNGLNLIFDLLIKFADVSWSFHELYQTYPLVFWQLQLQYCSLCLPRCWDG